MSINRVDLYLPSTRSGDFDVVFLAAQNPPEEPVARTFREKLKDFFLQSSTEERILDDNELYHWAVDDFHVRRHLPSVRGASHHVAEGKHDFTIEASTVGLPRVRRQIEDLLSRDMFVIHEIFCPRDLSRLIRSELGGKKIENIKRSVMVKAVRTWSDVIVDRYERARRHERSRRTPPEPPPYQDSYQDPWGS